MAGWRRKRERDHWRSDDDNWHHDPRQRYAQRERYDSRDRRRQLTPERRHRSITPETRPRNWTGNMRDRSESRSRDQSSEASRRPRGRGVSQCDSGRKREYDHDDTLSDHSRDRSEYSYYSEEGGERDCSRESTVIYCREGARLVPARLVPAHLVPRNQSRGRSLSEEKVTLAKRPRLRSLSPFQEPRFKRGRGFHGVQNSSAADWLNATKDDKNEPYRGQERQSDTNPKVVHFSNVAWSTTETYLRTQFESIDVVAWFEFLRRQDGKSLGQGSCRYYKLEAAKKAIWELDGQSVDGRKIRVVTANEAMKQEVGDDFRERGRDPNGMDRSDDEDERGRPVWVMFQHVPWRTSEEYLRELFEKVGVLKSFSLWKQSDGHSLGKGVAEFAHTSDAKRAVKTMSGYYVHGRTMYVAAFRSKPEQEEDFLCSDEEEDGLELDDDTPDPRRLCFENIPFGTSEGFLRSLFERIGKVGSFDLWRTPQGRSRGKGCCEYGSVELARQAMKALDGKYIDGRSIHVFPDPRPSGRFKARVFFHNVDWLTKPEELQAVFEKVGPVCQFELRVKPNGRSLGMGCCEYEEIADAGRAVEKINGTEVDGRKIFVASFDKTAARHPPGPRKNERQVVNKNDGRRHDMAKVEDMKSDKKNNEGKEKVKDEPQDQAKLDQKRSAAEWLGKPPETTDGKGDKDESQEQASTPTPTKVDTEGKAVIQSLQGTWSNFKDITEKYFVRGSAVVRRKPGAPVRNFRVHWDAANSQLQWGKRKKYYVDTEHTTVDLIAWRCDERAEPVWFWKKLEQISRGGDEREQAEDLVAFKSQCSSEQRKAIQEKMSEKLKKSMQGSGDPSVLAEYISVMLESGRPRNDIQSELEPFLKDANDEFLTWLCTEIREVLDET